MINRASCLFGAVLVGLASCADMREARHEVGQDTRAASHSLGQA